MVFNYFSLVHMSFITQNTQTNECERDAGERFVDFYEKEELYSLDKSG